MSFNDYWKEKVAKRRKSWASKSKRFADQHTGSRGRANPNDLLISTRSWRQFEAGLSMAI